MREFLNEIPESLLLTFVSLLLCETDSRCSLTDLTSKELTGTSFVFIS